MRKPKVFWLHFNRFDALKGDPDVWTVRQDNRNRYTRKINCKVPIQTVFRGKTGRQPKAYFRGVGRIRVGKKEITIF